jgi:hypothetical protein
MIREITKSRKCVSRVADCRIDGQAAFVICSSALGRRRFSAGRMIMTNFLTKTILAAAFATLTSSAFAQDATPWDLKPDMGYAYGKDGTTLSYKMGTNNAGTLLKGAKKVPKGTLFFIGQNGQLYMRSGPYLDGGGKFLFGSD